MVESMSRMTVTPLGSSGGSFGSGVIVPASSPQAGGEEEVVDLSEATINRLEAKVAEMRGLKVWQGRGRENRAG